MEQIGKPSPSDFFAICSILSAQQKALLFEGFIRDAYEGEHVPSANDRGDFVVDDKYYEVKTSSANENHCLNIRQIRLYQNVDYYLCTYIDELHPERSHCYRLTELQMTDEVKALGSFTHGTVEENMRHPNSEYSTIRMGTETSRRWDKEYPDKITYRALTRDIGA